MQLIMHELACFDRRTSERIGSISVKRRESIEDVSDRLRARMAEHDEVAGAMMVANDKLAMTIDGHLDTFRKELYYSLEKTMSSEEMRDAQLRDLMKRFDEYVAQQNSRMHKFLIDPVALRREIEARISTSRPASEPTKRRRFWTCHVMTGCSHMSGLFVSMPMTLRISVMLRVIRVGLLFCKELSSTFRPVRC